MPSSHLVYDGYPEPVSPIPRGLREPSVRRGGRRRLWGFHTDSRAPRPLRFCLSGTPGSYTNLKIRKSVTRRQIVGGIAQSPHGYLAEAARSKTRHGHRTISAQPLPGCRTGSERWPSGGCEDCAATSLRLHDFCTIFVQPLYGFTPAPPGSPYKKSHDARRQCEHIRRSP